MTSKKFPPIPPYYPAPSEGWTVPQPGAGYPPLPGNPIPRRTPPPLPPAFEQQAGGYAAPSSPMEGARTGLDPWRSSNVAQKDGMNPIQKFTHALSTGYMMELSAIIGADGSHWFLASETARALGYLNPRKAIIDHCKHAQLVGGVTNRDPIPGVASLDPQTKIIPEGDVNRLIARSRLPAAVEIQDWWFDEVIPTIRRTGGYGVQKPLTPRQLAQMVIDAENRADAENAARLAAEARHLVAERDNHRLEQISSYQNVIIKQQMEDLTGLHMVTNTSDSFAIRTVVKLLGQKEKLFNKWLREKKFTFPFYTESGELRGYQPYADKISAGYMVLRWHNDDFVGYDTRDRGCNRPASRFLKAGIIHVAGRADLPYPRTHELYAVRDRILKTGNPFEIDEP